MIDQALILAGGLGTRLGELTKSTPKPLLDVSERPFLEYILWNLKRHGIRRIVLSVGYMAEKIKAVLGDGSRLGIELTYLVEESPLGTGGALKMSADLLDEMFLVMNGDTIFDINYLDLSLSLSDSNISVVALRHIDDVSLYGHVRLDNGRIERFCEKSSEGQGVVSGGVYAMRKDALRFLPDGESSLEESLFPHLAASGLLGGRIYNGFFIDIGLPDTYSAAQSLLPEWKKMPAAFLDRDGVLNIDYGYVYRVSEFEWVDGAREAIRVLNESGYLVILITNQSGIGRGYYEEEEFQKLTVWMMRQMSISGAHLDGVYYCPHHPTEGKGAWKRDCRCRKPASGMIDKALNEWEIDLAKSFVIGDSAKDMELARAVNIPGYLFTNGSLLEFVENIVADQAF